MYIKNFKPMECPVCHEYYFADDPQGEKEEPSYEGKSPDYCSHCGWQYDLFQFEHPDVGDMTNKLSLNDYKIWYQKKIEEDPEYHYMTANYVEVPHMCPVCGKYEFNDTDSHDICVYCGWEDDQLMEDEPDEWAGCANQLCLNDARIEYKKKIEENPNYQWSKEVNKQSND